MTEKLIKVSEETHAELAALGKWGDTMDEIIQSLLHPKKQKKEVAAWALNSNTLATKDEVTQRKLKFLMFMVELAAKDPEWNGQLKEMAQAFGEVEQWPISVGCAESFCRKIGERMMISVLNFAIGVSKS
jgi:hypothetical protein